MFDQGAPEVTLDELEPAVIPADSVEFHGETSEVLDVPDVRAGVILGERFVFGLNGSSGVWVWPAEPGFETEVPGGTQTVSQLIGQTGTETSAWFHDAAAVDARDLSLFREIASETDPIEERMMIFDVADGDMSVVFDKLTRRDDLTYEEVALAYIGDAALTRTASSPTSESEKARGSSRTTSPEHDSPIWNSRLSRGSSSSWTQPMTC